MTVVPERAISFDICLLAVRNTIPPCAVRKQHYCNALAKD